MHLRIQLSSFVFLLWRNIYGHFSLRLPSNELMGIERALTHDYDVLFLFFFSVFFFLCSAANHAGDD